MQIILLDETRFDNFAMNHPNYNYYQTSNYGRFMSKHNYNAYYLGLTDDSGMVLAATLMLVKNENKDKRKMGYCPRGFLIDWNNTDLVTNFTNSLKEFLSKRNFIYLKVDPYVIYNEHNLDGSIKNYNTPNDEFIKNLQSLGYVHMGFNNGMEASKPRWSALTKLNNNTTSLYNSLSDEARNKIIKAFNLGNKIYKGSSNDISLLYSIINKTNPPMEYYLDYYQFFGNNNGFEIYFTKLEPVTFVNSSKTLYEKEEQKNNELNMQMQDYNNPNKNLIINEKLKSDERLSEYKRNMLDAINLFQKYPSGIVISAAAFIKCGKKIRLFASGVNDMFKDKYPEYLLIWNIMDIYAKQGYELMDLGGISGDFNTDYTNTFKRELSNNIVEYVGEFDLVINKKAYYTGSKLNPILNWLNTPI